MITPEPHQFTQNSMALKVDSVFPPRSQPRLLVIGSFLPGFELVRYAGGDVANKFLTSGARVIVTSGCRSRLLRLADMLLTSWRRRHDYDVAMVTVFSGYAFLYAEAIAWLLARLGKPYVLALHGGDLPAFSRRHAVRVRRLLSRAGAVVCPSGYLYEALKHLRPDLKLIPNAVDLSRYEFGSRHVRAGRLVWLRAFHHIYNPMMAPAVLAKVLKTFPQARLTMVGPDKGDGSYQATRQAAADLGVLDRIRFTGPIPKDSVPQVIGEHDIFLNTTNVDNTPVSLIEALACGLPVVSTNVGGIPYLVEHGQTALLVPPDDVEAMGASIIRLMAEPDLAAQLRSKGRRLAESFDWDVVFPQWQRVIQGVLTQQPAARK